jgi:predicted Zn-dependent peptidase
VVGDIDVVEMEKKIISHFATYKIPAENRENI